MKETIRDAVRALAALAAVVSLSAALHGCSDDDGGPGAAPIISELHSSPETLTLNQIGTLSGSIHFFDPDYDVVSIVFAVTPPQGSPQQTDPSPVSGVWGVEEGTIQWQLSVNAMAEDVWHFDIWLLDSKGNESNRLSGSFDVQPTDEATP